MIVDSNLIASLQIHAVPCDIRRYKRFQIIALSRNGVNKKTISGFTDCNMDMIYKWSRRSSFNDNARSGRPCVYDEKIQLKIIAFYCQTTPLPDCGRWTLRWAEKHLKEEGQNLIGQPVSRSTIQRILKKHNLKPHLSKYFLQITDPDFFPKMEHLTSLYMNQPEYLFCFDECPGIQVLQRLAPDLQTEEMKMRLEEFEYIRNGTVDVLAFLRIKSGKVFAECRADHTIETLLGVFEKHLKTLPENEILHYIMDNLASHASYELCDLVAKYSKIECPQKRELDTAVKRREWLQSENKRIVFHYTPFHGSWLNMVEIWFGILNQKCLKNSFDSPTSIYNAIVNFINEWNVFLAHPFNWRYDGKELHQKAVSRFIRMLENSTNKMTVKFMAKQFLLMTNLIKTYWGKVEFETWIKLYEVINSKVEQLNNNISQDNRPKRMENAKISLRNLIDTLRMRTYIVQKKAA